MSRDQVDLPRLRRLPQDARYTEDRTGATPHNAGSSQFLVLSFEFSLTTSSSQEGSGQLNTQN